MKSALLPPAWAFSIFAPIEVADFRYFMLIILHAPFFSFEHSFKSVIAFSA